MTGETFEQGKEVPIKTILRYQEFEKLDDQVKKVAEKKQQNAQSSLK